MTNKMTNAMALEIAINAVANEEAKAKLEKMLEQLLKKSAEKKPTANQEANVELKKEILAYMVGGEQYTITDLIKGCNALAEISNQRVSALMKQLIGDGKVTREEIKRKAYFSLVEEA